MTCFPPTGRYQSREQHRNEILSHFRWYKKAGQVRLLQYYMKFFGTPLVQVMELLKCLADDFAPPLMACPCGGGSKLRDCHGPKLTELRSHLPPKRFETELLDMIKLARAAGIRFSESKVRPKRIYKKRDRQRRKRNKGRDLIDLTARLSFNRCRGC